MELGRDMHMLYQVCHELCDKPVWDLLCKHGRF